MRADPSQLIPTRSSSAAEWIQWHKDLLSAFSKNQANTFFLKAWGLRGGSDSDANTDTLRAYLKDNGIEIDKSLLASVVDSGEGVIGSIGNILSIGKTAVIIIGVGLFIPIVLLLVNVARNPTAVAHAAGAGATGGIKP